MSSLKIITEDNEKLHEGVSGTGPFSFNFAYFDDDDLNVDVDGVTLPADKWYDTPVVVDGGYDGGTITLVDPVSVADIIIWRATKPLRETQISSGGAVSGALNHEFNRSITMIQDVIATLSRALVAQRGEPLPTLPNKADILGKLFWLNESGDGFDTLTASAFQALAADVGSGGSSAVLALAAIIDVLEDLGDLDMQSAMLAIDTRLVELTRVSTALEAGLFDNPAFDDIAQLVAPAFDTMSALLANTSYTYTGGLPGTLTAGEFVRTRAEGIIFKVAAEGASDHDLVTAGGIKLYEAWPFSTKTRLKRHDPTGLSAGYTIAVDGNVWRWDPTVPVQVHQSDATEIKFAAPDAGVNGAWENTTPDATAPAWDQIKMRMALGRVNFVGIGDSNQIHSGYGWDHGFQYALSQNFPQYATDYISFNENNSEGNGRGYHFGYNASAPVHGVTTGAPAFFDDYLDSDFSDLGQHMYGYLSTGSVSSAANTGGIIITPASPLDVTKAMSYDYHYGTFASGSGGSFAVAVRKEASPYTVYSYSSPISTTTGVDGIAIYTLELAADEARTVSNIGAKWTRPGVTNITAPFFGLWSRLHVPSQTTGWSYCTMVYRGGVGLRTMALGLQNSSDTALSYYFGDMRRLQGDTKTIAICINSGLNDRNETLTSVGPATVADGDSAAAFVDNFVAIKERIEEIWTDNGWDLNEIYWLVFPSHPVSDPDDAELLGYRRAIRQYLRMVDHAQYVDLEQLASSSEMLSNGWYMSAGVDRNHLTQSGYEQLSLRLVKGALR